MSFGLSLSCVMLIDLSALDGSVVISIAGAVHQGVFAPYRVWKWLLFHCFGCFGLVKFFFSFFLRVGVFLTIFRNVGGSHLLSINVVNYEIFLIKIIITASRNTLK